MLGQARPYEVTVRRGGKALYLGRYYLLQRTTTTAYYC